jgi:hypothetical protein
VLGGGNSEIGSVKNQSNKQVAASDIDMKQIEDELEKELLEGYISDPASNPRFSKKNPSRHSSMDKAISELICSQRNEEAEIQK